MKYQYLIFVGLVDIIFTDAIAQKPPAGSQNIPMQQIESPIKFPDNNVNSQFMYKIISSAANTFGYDVYRNGNLLIHQPTIPGMGGVNGFKTKQDAKRVAELVLMKIKKGEIPPSITEEDLKFLKVKKVDSF
jgi:hypothetical protein